MIACLPMYDWPEARAETDAYWVALRDAFRAAGIKAPQRLVRRNADMPAVPGGIRDQAGAVIVQIRDGASDAVEAVSMFASKLDESEVIPKGARNWVGH